MLHKYHEYRVGRDNGSDANYDGEISVNQNRKVIFVHVDVIFDPVQHWLIRFIGDVEYQRWQGRQHEYYRYCIHRV